MLRLCFLLIFWCIVHRIGGYRLNVPRVLLPFHRSAAVKFDLIVTDPTNGCFTWRTTRPDVVSVEAVNPRGTNGCSAEAQITATSKHAEEQTAVVFAEDKGAGVVLSCGVTVDVIKRISISTTTKVLFLDASPAKIAVQAYNAEGDMFTNLGEIPFEWHLESSSVSERPLRIVPFSQSKYEAPNGVRLLEENKKRGYVILVEGLSTGAAVLKAKLVDPDFENVESQAIELIVVANILLVPSQDIFLPLGSVVRYSAEIVKQSTTERISLPSRQYHLVVKDSKICSLDLSTSEVTAINFGITEISLIDENVKSLNALKPPSARIHVVEPATLYIRVSGNSWFLEKGREYHIFVVIADADDNIMYIPENVKIESTIPDEYFKVVSKSRNGSFFHVRTVKSGVTKLRAAFVSLVNKKEEENRMPSSISGDVTATISEPVEVVPAFVAFPYIDAKRTHSWKLLAQGGTGSFIWSSLNPDIVSVDSTGVLLSGKLGATEVIVRDAQNSAHFGKAVVQVLQPSAIAFGKSGVEAEVGTNLILYVTLRAASRDGEVTISDCRHADFTMKVKDSNIFRVVTDNIRELSPYGDGCSSFLLTAAASGDTIATVHFGSLHASIQISAYPPLKLEAPSTALIMLGSKFVVRTSGGPRPWILDSSNYYSKLVFNNATNLISQNAQNEHTVTCKSSNGDTTIQIVVGNEASPTNPVPAEARTKLRVCCGIPNRLKLSLLRPQQSTCPPDVHTVSFMQPSNLVISAFGHCESGPLMGVEKQFDSITSLEVDWIVSDKNIAHVVEDRENPELHRVHAILKPRKMLGKMKITASSRKCKIGRREHRLPVELGSTMEVDLVANAQAVPSTVVLLNEKRASKVIQLEHGSGHFALRTYDPTILDAILQNSIAKISPLAVGKSILEFMDRCIGSSFTATVSVTDVEEILIEAPEFIALNGEQEIQLKVRNVEGSLFVTDDADIMNVQLNASAKALAITRVDALHYILRGDAVGVVTLRASARRANGRMLQSQSLSIQIYSPLQLQPKVITLIPDSVFQLEISGGPQPLPPVRYRLNDTLVASVASNGLVTSRTVGYASIIGSADLDNSASIEDEIVVKVVSISGIRLRASTSRLQVDEEAWIRVEGLADDETPFSFGGALYPFKITWTTITPGIIEIVSAHEGLITESAENRFQAELKALRTGQTTIHVSVTVSANSKAFFKAVRHYDSHLTVTVVEALKLITPSRHPQPLRLSPDAKLDLKSNRRDSSVQFIVQPEHSKHVALVGETNNTLWALTVGDAAVVLKQVEGPYSELIHLPVSVAPIASLHLVMKYWEIPNETLTVLPLGYRLHVDVECRDHLGRLFDAAMHSLNYRPHRFDLTEVHPTNDNHSFDIQLKDVGETVFKVWDRNNPELNVFLRLPVGDVIMPKVSSVVVSEIVCFKSPLSTDSWRELDARGHFQFIDERNGVAVAVNPGNAVVASFGPQKQTLFTKRKIVPASSLRFSTVPQFISNVKGYKHLFPVIINGDEQHKLSNVYDCNSSALEILKLNAPFDCTVGFVGEVNVPASALLIAHSAFFPVQGEYGCVLEEHAFEGPSSIMEYHDLTLSVSATWKLGGKVEQAAVMVTFYPRFEVVQREIRLNNVNTLEADLVIHSPVSIASKIAVETDAGSVLHIRKIKSVLPTVLNYRIKLDMQSALLWQELLDKCNITVKNAVTGQREIVPVTIVLHGDTSKAVLRASNDLLGLLGSFLESTIVQVCAWFLTAAVIVLTIGYCKGYNLSSYWFNPAYSADPSSTYGLFARDHSGWRSHLDVASGKDLLGSPNISSLSSRSSRSAGSPGEPILWSVPDRSLSPVVLRKRLKM